MTEFPLVVTRVVSPGVGATKHLDTGAGDTPQGFATGVTAPLISVAEDWHEFRNDTTHQRFRPHMGLTSNAVAAPNWLEDLAHRYVFEVPYDGLAHASQVGTFVGPAENNATVTITGPLGGAIIYMYKDVLTGAQNEILTGGSIGNSLNNLIRGIMGAGREGTDVGIGTLPNPDVYAYNNGANGIVVVSRKPGRTFNTITVAETSAAQFSWAAGVLSGGGQASLVAGDALFASPGHQPANGSGLGGYYNDKPRRLVKWEYHSITGHSSGTVGCEILLSGASLSPVLTLSVSLALKNGKSAISSNGGDVEIPAGYLHMKVSGGSAAIPPGSAFYLYTRQVSA